MEDFEEIYKSYARPVKKYVMTLCGNDALADDITADTFCKALRNIDEFDGKSKVLTWLCTIAKNTYLDCVKRREYQNLPLTEEQNLIPAERGRPDSELEAKQRRLELYRSIQSLEGAYRDVIYLRVFANLSFGEIGDILGKSENWARVTFYRGKNRLKGMIDNEI